MFRRKILVFLCTSLLAVGNTHGRAQALRRQMFPTVVLAWEAFQEVTLIAPWVASEASKILMELDTNLGYHQVYPWYIPTLSQW